MRNDTETTVTTYEPYTAEEALRMAECYEARALASHRNVTHFRVAATLRAWAKSREAFNRAIERESKGDAR
jgi:hypothetical protein